MSHIVIDGKEIGDGFKTYIIAEISANHGGDFELAKEMIHAAKEMGADAVKLQTYTADILTLDCNHPPFYLTSGPWAGQTLHELYKKAYTPWDWQPKLKEIADKIGITLFSSCFDPSSADFLEKMNVPAYKIASPELIEYNLLRHVAKKNKPILLSTGKATIAEIDKALSICRENSNENMALLHCISEYPAPYSKMNLRCIPLLKNLYKIPVGISDHSLGIAIPIAAVTLGANIVEKHFILKKDIITPDSFFSLDYNEFSSLIKEIRNVEDALKSAHFPRETDNTRRSIYAKKDIKKGEVFTHENIGTYRPGGGLLPEFINLILGRKASKDIKKGQHILWEDVE